jgi:hypothetical protein
MEWVGAVKGRQCVRILAWPCTDAVPRSQTELSLAPGLRFMATRPERRSPLIRFGTSTWRNSDGLSEIRKELRVLRWMLLYAAAATTILSFGFTFQADAHHDRILMESSESRKSYHFRSNATPEFFDRCLCLSGKPAPL